MQYAKRFFLLIISIFIIAVIIISENSNSIHNIGPSNSKLFNFGTPQFETPDRVVMSKMGNETLRQQLGRASWHLLHTMSVKYPVNPTKQDQKDYLSFIKLFAQFYPCGDCARHFQRLLVQKPPRVSDRENVIQWTCEIHNLVNRRLDKPEFDCSTAGDKWKCGCADEEPNS